MPPAGRGGCGYFHVTLVSVPGTVIYRTHLSRTRYEATPATASQANETLHDVLPVETRLNGFAGGLPPPDFADEAAPGAVIDDASGRTFSWHPAAATRSDPARAYPRDCRNEDMGRLRGTE